MTVRQIRHIALSLLVVFALIVCAVAFASNTWDITSLYERTTELNPGWTMVPAEENAPVGTIALERVFSAYELQHLEGEPAVFFRTYNMAVLVRVNGNYVYSFGRLGHKFAGSECGSALHFFRLANYNNRGFTAHIEFSPAFQPKRNSLFTHGSQIIITPRIYFGSKTACQQEYIKSCLLPAILSGIIILLGIMYLFLTGAFWVLHRQYTRDFCYWGVFSLIMGAGFFIESGMADFVIANSFVRYFASTLLLAILPEFFLMYVRSSKLLPYHTKMGNFFITLSIVNAFLVCICAFIPTLPFSYVRNYIILMHAAYLFFVIALFINNSIGLSKLLNIPSFFVIITALAMLVDFTLCLVPPYRADLFTFSRPCMLLYLIARTIEIISEFYGNQILSAREEMYRSVIVRDSLTNVLNRQAFWRFQKDFFTRNYAVDGRLRLVLCEIANLKMINQTNGYETGDEALKTVAQMLKLQFTQENVYRLDGSCFAILLVDAPATAVQATVAAVKDVIADYNDAQNGAVIRLCISDTQFFQATDESFDAFLTRAQQTLCETRQKILANP